ncbi:MAG: hypothetical protein SF339_13835 [Blastocatellia bacterium]|nr:hypothetical protein [Blastocatellia bacterium]
MANALFHRIGIALSTIGMVILLLTIAEWLFALPIFDETPTLLALTFVISGAAFLAAARAGQ